MACAASIKRARRSLRPCRPMPPCHLPSPLSSKAGSKPTYLTSLAGEANRWISPMMAPRANATTSRTPQSLTRERSSGSAITSWAIKLRQCLRCFSAWRSSMSMPSMTCHCRTDHSLALRNCSSTTRSCTRAGPFFSRTPLSLKVRAEPGAHLRGAFGRFAMRVEPVAALLGLFIRHPHLSGRPGQVSLADAHRAHFVVIGVGFFEFAQMTTLQHQCAAANCSQRAHHLKAVARGFQNQQIIVLCVLLGPVLQLSHRHLVECLFYKSLRRSLPPEHGHGKTVRVRIQTDHTPDRS